jgi:transposase-like protein
MEQDLIKAVMEGQAGLDECRQAMSEAVRGIMVQALMDEIREEVTQLCGARYYPAEGATRRRAGSSQGRFLLDGREERFRRPRVREKQGREVRLRTYAAVREAGRVREKILRAVAGGVSSRDVRGMYPAGGRGFSASEVSRHWVAGSLRYLAMLRERDVQGDALGVLMLDGIVLSEGVVIIVALGILGDGRKRMLDFEVGSTESYEVGHALLERLDRRGVRFGGRPFCVLDGSQPLRKAVKERYPEVIIQRCLVHKERNLRGCLSRKDYPELNRLMNRLRRAQGALAAREALGDLKRFVAGKNRAALDSVEEAGEELIALHLLEAPSTLQVNLLSTNAIENPIRNFRAKTRRVTRWRPQGDMTERWTAYAMLTVEQGFQRLSGHRDLPVLLRALQWTEDTIRQASGPVSRSESGGRDAP